MKRFEDRMDAAKQLAQKLSRYKNCGGCVVIGLPRGGVVLAHEVAQQLGLPLDIVISRKIGAPGQQELALGAVAEDGVKFFNEDIIQMLGLSESDLEGALAGIKKEIARRVALYRKGRPVGDLHSKTVILVDDGVATGATMLVTIDFVKQHGAHKVIVAVPVLPQEAVAVMVREADELVYLEAPESFPGVGYFYDSFNQVRDDEVIELLR
jgi:putative phosphoribosyl transferase